MAVAVIRGEVLEALSLEDLRETIEREHQLVVQTGVAMIEHAIAAGEALLAAKTMVPRGEWEAWLTANFPDRHPKTHRLYMRVAKFKDRVRAAAPATLSEAHKLLEGEAQRPYEPAMRDAARQLRREGLTYAQIADELGASTYAVEGWCNPKTIERRRQRRRAESRAARRALTRQERDRDARKAGGSLAETYALLRKALQAAERAAEEATSREVREAISAGVGRMHYAEDEIVKAVRLS